MQDRPQPRLTLSEHSIGSPRSFAQSPNVAGHDSTGRTDRTIKDKVPDFRAMHDPPRQPQESGVGPLDRLGPVHAKYAQLYLDSDLFSAHPE